MSGYPTDDEIMAALRGSGRTWQIARRLTPRQTTSYVRSRMRRLEAAGRVQRHERYTAENDIYWIPADAEADAS